jgi:hypothetical protein
MYEHGKVSFPAKEGKTKSGALLLLSAFPSESLPTH